MVPAIELEMLAVLDEFSRKSRSIVETPLDWLSFISLLRASPKPGNLLSLASSRTQYQPLHFTAHFTSPEYTALLLALGAHPDAREGVLNRTPLQLAVINGRFHPEQAVETARALLVFGRADPNLDYCRGTTPLFDAVSTDNLPMVRLLLEHGADVRAVVSSDEPAGSGEKQILFSPLFVALYHGKTKILQLILKAGAQLADDASVPSVREMLVYNSVARDCLRRLSIDPDTLDSPKDDDELPLEDPDVGEEPDESFFEES